MAEFIKAVRDYGISERRALHFITNDAKRARVGCEKWCTFYLWCSRLEGGEAVQIKTCQPDHLCTKPYHNRLVSVKYLTEMYGEKIRKNPQWKVKEMQETIRQELEIDVPRIKCSRVRQATLAGVLESMKCHYSRVWDFGFELIKNNPKNTCKIMTNMVTNDSVNTFKRIYICYEALKQGWKLGCKPILGIDGCFLKNVCGGQLLSAVGRDANNNMYPVAIAVVETESTDSWRWFLQLLKDDLSLGNGHAFTFISDQQKVLVAAMKELLPRAEHRLCTRHLYNNFKKRFPQGTVKHCFWTAACATYPALYHKAMKLLQRVSKNAYDELSRYMPLLNMIQEIHFKIMRRIRINRDSMAYRDLPICPGIKYKLDAAINASRK
ncbi:uncharacterized protein LOC141694472 [Apium graveolens]|uniref:uncharacterized protein LOC141694472 n=1 Tax=Apium graveolens TaxID=4045 RepID=UPI003D7AF4D4